MKETDLPQEFVGPSQKLIAPKGKFKVIGVDTFEGPFADYPIGIYKTLKEAKRAVDTHGGVMNLCYCYNDKGKMVYKAGSF